MVIGIFGMGVFNAQSILAAPPDRCETSNQPSPQSACSYAPGSNANSPGCSLDGQKLCSASDFSPSHEARGFCGGDIHCDNNIGPNTFAPGQNPNRP